MNNRIQIECNNHSYKKDIYYVAIGLRGGHAVRNYILDEKKSFTSNYAFFSVLFNYFTECGMMAGVNFDVQRAVSTISFSRKKDGLIPTIEKVLQTLFSYEYSQEIFERAKLASKNSFSERYKDGAFRSRYKAYEFSELNKSFTLKSMISDIEGIDLVTFTASAKALLVPGNVCIYIVGDLTGMDWKELTFPEIGQTENHSVRIAGFEFDPFLRQNAHITSIAREEHNTIIEAFDFLNPNTSNFAKMLIVEMLAEQIPVYHADAWVDSLDASIIFSCELPQSYKQNCYIDTEKAFLLAQSSLLKKYAALLEGSPEHFAIKGATLMTLGIYTDQYLVFLSQCSYEMFKEICETADYKVSEAQIVMRKGSK